MINPFQEANTIGKSELEGASISSLSRQQVVDAYATWTEVSASEALCVDFALRAGGAVLDLGCGAGRLANWMSGRIGSYIGIDASEPMIKVAREKYPELTFLVGDILGFEAPDSSLDLILLAGNVLDFLHPIERRSALLERCFRWIRPGGFVVGSSHLTHARQLRGFYTEDYHGSPIHQFRSSAGEMISEVEAYGFEIALLSREYRKDPAEWANWVALKSIDLKDMRPDGVQLGKLNRHRDQPNARCNGPSASFFALVRLFSALSFC